jgi:GT2 family glycosyltransferase
MASSAGLTAVVITHNRAGEVIHAVGRMRALPEIEHVVVIDNASRDGTAARLRARFPDVLVVVVEDNLGAAARNIGLRLARTSYVALCDDDTWWEPGCLGRAAAILQAYPRIAVLTARVLVEPEGRTDPTSLRMAASPLDSTGLPGAAVLGFLAGAALVRREAFLEVGGFDPRFMLGREEGLLAFDLAARGWRMLYVHDCIVHHRPSAQRDVSGRRRILLRNTVALAWLRLPFLSAVRETLQALRHAAREGILREVIASVAKAAPWMLEGRRVIPPAVERARRQVEHDDAAPRPTTPWPLPRTVR